MVYQELTFCQFCDCFRQSSRDNFSYEALRALYDYYDNEFDSFELVVADVDMEWCEQSIEDAANDYDIDIEDIVSYLKKNTIVLFADNETVLYQTF